MKLSLEQAATRLGKSKRQVLYMIHKGTLPAEKVAGSWFIDTTHLPIDVAQQQRVEQKQRQFKAAVEEALAVDSASPARRYSVRDLKAFQIALPLYRKACQVLAADHPASVALKHVLESLTEGCHRFDRQEKAAAYRAARDQASRAVCELLLDASQGADELTHALEQELMAALAGLMRRMEGRSRGFM